MILRMNKALLTGMAGLGLSLLVATAHAQTSGPFTFTVAQSTTDFTNNSIVLPKFNTALGTLTSVTLSTVLSGNFGGSVTNNAAGPSTFKVTEDVNLTLSTNGIQLLNPLGEDLAVQQTYTALASKASSPFGPYTPSVSDSATYTSGSPFSLFVGPGNLSFILATLTSTTFAGGGGNIINNITTTAGGSVSVVYAYRANAVPEPGSIAMLLGTGLTGAGFLVRRRKAIK